MSSEDLIYLCTMIGNLSGIPARLYEGKNLLFCFSQIRLPVDPAAMEEEALLSRPGHVACHITRHLDYYCILNAGDFHMVVGPSREVDYTDRELRRLAFELSVPAEENDAFIMGMKQIVRMPMSTMIQIMCAMNFAVNHGEKLTLDDVVGGREATRRLERKRHEAQLEGEAPTHRTAVHNTLDIERLVTDIVRRGDLASLEAFADTAPALRPGIMASDQLRQAKNTFIVTAALVSRAAIAGGMDQEDALGLSDVYIQRCELEQDIARLTRLTYEMVHELTEQVSRIRSGGLESTLVIQVGSYVRHHISEPITTEEIAKSLYLSRQHFSKRFTEEVGMPPAAFVRIQKAEEAKHLLRYTDKPISTIALYLGFSSQSHFSRVFREITGKTPGEYRSSAKAP